MARTPSDNLRSDGTPARTPARRPGGVSARASRRRMITGGYLLLALWCGVSLPGCINVLAMGAKVIMGDPRVPAPFKARTGIDLEEGKHTVALVVDAPFAVAERFDTLLVDVQDEVLRLLKRHDIPVASIDDIDQVLDAAGGNFSAAAIAAKLDVDVVVHVQIERITDTEQGSPSLFHGRAQGLVRGFVVRGERGTESRAVVEVYEEGFTADYPRGHPVPADQTTQRVFRQGFSREVADAIGRQFYDVYTRDLF